MAFCGHCGYQLSKGDKTCPQCGAETDIDLAEYPSPDPEAHHATEISHSVLNYPQVSSPQNFVSQPRYQAPQGPLVLGQSGSEQMANEATTMMNSQVNPQMNSQIYAPPQVYSAPNYPQQVAPGTGFYNPANPGYNVSGYQQPLSAHSSAVEQLLENSRKGKTTSLLLVLFGLLLLIAAIVIFLLSHQGIIFS